MVKRIYVEKKSGFDASAKALLEELSGSLRIANLVGVRILNRYDIEGLDEETYDRAKFTVFAEPAIDNIYEEVLPEDFSPVLFAVEYLPGQYDQRADSAVQCIRMINVLAEPLVKFARIIALTGQISEQELAAIKNYCINPVDSREADLEKPDKLRMDSVDPADVEIVSGFTAMNADELAAYRKEMGFAMSEDDIAFVQTYFAEDEKRDPTITELRVLDTYWSDHCRHTTFLTKLTDIDFDNGPYADLVKQAFSEYMEMREEVYGNQERNICLMDIACIGAKLLKKRGLADDVDVSDEVNACSIKVKAEIDGKEEDWLVMFKNETHNHPTEIEPFGGAATCLGGAIRDPLSGRAYVYQAMRVTGSADPRRPVEDTLPGKLPQRKITQDAAAGYSSYGNQIGLATGQVCEIYDEGYVAKRMEVGAVIGAAPADHVRREKPISGDVVILVGGRTGRDGCGGATGSSKEHTEESILTCGAEVQKGNPPVERNIQRMFRRGEVARLIKRCNDFGAGGVSVAIGELADSLDVNLDLIPKKYEGLDGTELAISESQERMAVVVPKEDQAQFIAFAKEENLEATVVANVTDTGRFRMFWRGKCILDLSRKFLETNGTTQTADVFVRNKEGIGDTRRVQNGEGVWELLGDLNCCSQRGLVSRFDSTIGAASVLMPLGGKYQLSPALGMAAKLPVTDGDTDTTTLMAYGFDPAYSKASPFHGAMYAVIDSVTKIVAMGGDFSKVRLSFQEYFERMTDARSWAKPFEALLGALKVQKELGIPAIGGKDSMSGTFMDINVPPTLISFAVAVTKAGRVISTEFKEANSRIVLIRAKRDENAVIDFHQYKRNMARVAELSARHKILAANTIGSGGIFISLIKMAVGNKIGFHLDSIKESELYEADYGAVILEVSAQENIEALLSGLEYRIIGKTNRGEEIVIESAMTMQLDEAIERWGAPLERIFPVRTVDYKKQKDKCVIERISYNERPEYAPQIRIAKPRVLIPTFPGTNCEMDSKRAFDRAGAISDIHIMRNLTTADLIESIDELAEKIKKSQIIMIPGGFSGGDEPDGSAKFIAAVFRNPKVQEAVMELMEQRDGLILGVCNGFQALIKLGLVPYGRIEAQSEDDPTLTYNKIGRHASCLVRTRVASVKSPWFSGVSVGDIHTIPVSHGEGRFFANDHMIQDLIQNGQIATQYVDPDGNPSMDIEFNPNYSTYAVEAITSPDGRILGKMAHSERIGQHLYKNVIGEKDQKIFESGVKYFKD